MRIKRLGDSEYCLPSDDQDLPILMDIEAKANAIFNLKGNAVQFERIGSDYDQEILTFLTSLADCVGLLKQPFDYGQSSSLSFTGKGTKQKPDKNKPKKKKLIPEGHFKLLMIDAVLTCLINCAITNIIEQKQTEPISFSTEKIMIQMQSLDGLSTEEQITVQRIMVYLKNGIVSLSDDQIHELLITGTAFSKSINMDIETIDEPEGRSEAKICLNGHVNQPSGHEDVDTHCPLCGMELLLSCPNCHHPFSQTASKEHFCYQCGSAYPWVKAALDGIKSIIEEDSILTDTMKKQINDSLWDLISETPKTPLALARLKKCLSNAEKQTSDALLGFIRNYGCSTVQDSYTADYH